MKQFEATSRPHVPDVESCDNNAMGDLGSRFIYRQPSLVEGPLRPEAYRSKRPPVLTGAGGPATDLTAALNGSGVPPGEGDGASPRLHVLDEDDEEDDEEEGQIREVLSSVGGDSISRVKLASMGPASATLHNPLVTTEVNNASSSSIDLRVTEGCASHTLEHSRSELEMNDVSDVSPVSQVQPQRSHYGSTIVAADGSIQA